MLLSDIEKNITDISMLKIFTFLNKHFLVFYKGFLKKHILKKTLSDLKIAIIIPYRDREDHLITLLSYLHPILQRQQLDYRIYVTEQVKKNVFT